MTVKVIAWAPDDGWAFIEVDKIISLLRPPYNELSPESVPTETVEKAINFYGFKKCGSNFDSVNDVISMLKNKYIKIKEFQTSILPSDQEIIALLNLADEGTILEYLNKGETDLIPQGRFDEVNALITKIGKTKYTKNNSNINEAMRHLYEICSKEKEEFIQNKKKIWSLKYPKISGEYSIEHVIELQRRTSASRQIFPIAIEG